MASAIELRPARAQDLERILALLERLELPVEGVVEHLATFLVGEQCRGLVGVAGLEHHGSAALLRSVAVDPARQGAGFGKRLAVAAIERARAAGARQVYLLTLTAERFFARLGFAVIEHDLAPVAIRDSAEFTRLCPATAVLMRLALAPMPTAP
jgi:amino-acid N-acetyltransferase